MHYNLLALFEWDEFLLYGFRQAGKGHVSICLICPEHIVQCLKQHKTFMI